MTLRIRSIVWMALLAMTWALPAYGDAPASSAAAPTPPAAATLPPRFEMVMPPGFQKIAVGAHVAVCLPQDADWVRKALADIKPATRPSTMPVDVIQRTAGSRAAVIKQMAADFALPDDKALNALFDEKLQPMLKKLDELKPPVFFLVVTRQRLRELCQTGWGEPRFHYNRAAGEVNYRDNVMLSIDRPMDDSVLPFFYEEKETADERGTHLAQGVRHLDYELAKLIADQTQPSVFNLVAQHIGTACFDLDKTPRDQQWLVLGATGYFTAKYAGMLTLIPREQWLKEMTRDDRRFPVTARGIDLAHPVDPSAMKPAAVPYYDQAMRRKAVGVIMHWAEKGGDASVSKVLAAWRAKPPADGAALLKMVRELAGIDLSAELAPR